MSKLIELMDLWLEKKYGNMPVQETMHDDIIIGDIQLEMAIEENNSIELKEIMQLSKPKKDRICKPKIKQSPYFEMMKRERQERLELEAESQHRFKMASVLNLRKDFITSNQKYMPVHKSNRPMTPLSF